MKYLKLVILSFLLVGNSFAISLDTQNMTAGKKVKASTISSFFNSIENAINNLLSKQETTVLWAGTLANATSLINTAGDVVKFNEVENTNSAVFSYNTSNGEITVLQKGIITYNQVQDIQHNCSYSTVLLLKNGTNLVASLNYHTGASNWDGLSISSSFSVIPNDKLLIKIVCSGGNILSLDPSYWSRTSLKWNGVLE